ncbi:MAG: hypothetical protein ACETWM_18225 [Candidatus Lokiarchaeia archaeon]
MASIDREKLDKESESLGEAILLETKTLEDFKCGNCGVPLSIHVFFKGNKLERVVECKGCEISFPLEGNQNSTGAKACSSKKDSMNKKEGENKKESMVERLVKSW